MSKESRKIFRTIKKEALQNLKDWKVFVKGEDKSERKALIRGYKVAVDDVIFLLLDLSHQEEDEE